MSPELKPEEEQDVITITRKGTWPILCYNVRSKWGHYSNIFMDDDDGSIVIAWDNHTFQHWWGRKGRVNPTLREFLVRTNKGYIMDKFSYGLSRWDGEKALNQFRKDLVEKYGADPEDPKEPDWKKTPYEIYEMYENLEDRMSSDAFYAQLYSCDKLSELYPDYECYPSGERGANIHVINFVEKYWPSLVKHWQDELDQEKQHETATSPA